LNDIGTLRLNQEGNLEFEPCEAGILTPDLYGFGSFEMKTLSQQRAEEQANKPITTINPTNDDTITIKMSWLRNAVAVAAAIIAFFMIGTPVSNSEKTADLQQSSFINVKAPHSTSTSINNTSMLQAETPAEPIAQPKVQEQSADEAESPAAEQPSAAVVKEHFFCIVMASQVSEKNANLFISQLSDKGFGDARILITGSKNIRRVVYGTFETEADAVNTLHELRKESRLFKETWIMEV
jgi:cell division septation protein DedD